MHAQDAVRNRQIWVLPPRRSDQNAVSAHGDRIRQVAQAEGVREGSLEEGSLSDKTLKVRLSKRQNNRQYTAGSRAQGLALE